MIDERHEELAALHALDLLEGPELAAFETELASNAALRVLVDQLRTAATGLAHTVPASAPSPALRARLLASIAAVGGVPSPRSETAASTVATSATPIATAKPSPAKIIPFPAAVWTGWAAAACFAIAAAYFGANYFAARSALTAASNDAEFARLEAQSLAQRLEAERILNSSYIASLQKSGDVANLKIAKLADLLGNSPQAVAIAVWNPLSQSGVLTVEKLPVLQNDQDYQLWVIDPAYKDPVSGGVFTVDANGIARVEFRPGQSVKAATTFAISRERKGGSSSTPQGPVIAAGTL
jgi:anti-sigma-K factor RskA